MRQRRVIRPNLEHAFIRPFVWMASGRLIGKLQTRNFGLICQRLYILESAELELKVRLRGANTSPRALALLEDFLLTVTKSCAG